jgi:hypothetical protein
MQSIILSATSHNGRNRLLDGAEIPAGFTCKVNVTPLVGGRAQNRGRMQHSTGLTKP